MFTMESVFTKVFLPTLTPVSPLDIAPSVETVFVALMICCGALWTLAYALIIRRGFLDRTYGMPLVALCGNLSWEFIYTLNPQRDFQLPINALWLCVDLVLLLQLLKYGPREFVVLPKRVFHAGVVLALAMSFMAHWSVSREFGDPHGVYSGWVQCMLMSALFLGMLLARKSSRGQSVPIALSKMSGTALAVVAFLLYPTIYEGSALLPFVYAATLVFDLIYAVALYALRKAEKRAECQGPLPYRPPARTVARTGSSP